MDRFTVELSLTRPTCPLFQRFRRCMISLNIGHSVGFLFVFMLAFASSALTLAASGDAQAAPLPVKTTIKMAAGTALALTGGPKENALSMPASHPALSPEPDKPFPSQTLLDEVGYLARPVNTATVTGWKDELASPSVTKERAALLHLWFGEYLLAEDKAPELSHKEFATVQSLVKASDPLYGLSSYDLAVASYYQGAYRDASDDFGALIAPSCHLTGFDRLLCARFYKHAEACANYHTERARAGIPEPPVLDPRCAAAALATCLQALNLPYDEASVRKVCPITGEGSTLPDIVNATKKLCLKIHLFGADEQGLILAPKPLIAYVEHDHYVAVTLANSQGVTYLCSDCGPWPGGPVHLTWKQWSMLDASQLASLDKPGSYWDIAFDEAQSLPVGKSLTASFNAALPITAARSRLLVASVGKLSGLIRLRKVLPTALLVAELRSHLDINNFIDGVPVDSCGTKPGSLQCPPYIICCWPCFLNSLGFDGPSDGDPVNLATGEEEYTPPADLTVYNPVGPPVVWNRIYNSLRPSATTYEGDDFGSGWSTSYNVGVYDSTDGDVGTKYVLFPNGGRVAFTASGLPVAGASVNCQVIAGADLLVTWNYSPNGYYYVITMPDRTRWVTQPWISNIACCPLAQIIDRNGNAISFNYTQPAWNGGWPLLSSITNKVGTTLLSIVRTQDGTGNITSVSDCYGRSVYYHVGVYPTTGVSTQFAQSYQELDWLSQIVATGTTGPPLRYVYGYTGVENGDGVETVPFLGTIKVPSPTGSGFSTATIGYTSYYVSSTIDGNGNVTSYTPSPTSDVTTMTVTGPTMREPYTYSKTFDQYMELVSETDGAGNAIQSNSYLSNTDPYKPSKVTDGNGNATNFTYDTFGNVLTEESPRLTVTTNTYNYTNFALGELTESQDGTNLSPPKSPVVFTYYEPSGNIATYEFPLPNTINSTEWTQASMTWDALGNVTSVTLPGNNATVGETEVYGYTSDGPYSQAEALGQPLTVTDALGETTHYRYTSRGLTSETIDALGIETELQYNLADQELETILPATGQTGTGQSYTQNSYLYTGGPLLTSAAFDESGNQTRLVNQTYGGEGEPLITSGSTETAIYTYDQLYRTNSLEDGDGPSHTTNYYYNGQGYLDTVTYPGYSGPVPTYNATTGAWNGTNGTATGPDSMRASGFDHDGNILYRIDGRGVTTSYIYSDPESKLTGINYQLPGAKNPYTVSNSSSVSLSYDAYGRLTKADNRVTQVYPTYDDDDDVVDEVTNYYAGGTISFDTSLVYSYYADGSLQSLTTPANTTFTYYYDATGRPIREINPFGETTSWTYLQNGWLSGQNLGNGASAGYSYNDLGELTSLYNFSGSGNVLSDYSGITYDSVGNRVQLTANIPAYQPYSGTTSFAYDAKDELTNESGTRNGGLSSYFSYDAAENPTVFRNQQLGYSNNDNQYTAGGNAYDGDGNPSTYEGQNFGYDVENRLTSVGSTFSANYGVDGLRASKTEGTVTTYYLYPLGSTIPVCEFNASGALTATNTVGADGLISRNTSAGSTFYQFDPQGTVADRTNSTGIVTSASISDAFGEVSNSTSITDPFGYDAQDGYYTDQSTGLLLAGFRYYDPGAGRFLTRDPIGYEGGINDYGYVGNDAENENDPEGTEAPGVPIKGGSYHETSQQAVETVTFVLGLFVPGAGPEVAAAEEGLELAADAGGAAAEQAADEAVSQAGATPPTYVIGKVHDLQNVGENERTLLDRLPWKRDPRLDWKQNSGVLRSIMKLGRPIRDASPKETGPFLNAERCLLKDRGWQYNEATTFWYAPR